MSLIKKFYSKTLVFWSGDNLTLIGIDVEVLASIDEGKIFGALDDEEDNVFDIEDEWRSPVHDVIYITLGSSAHD